MDITLHPGPLRGKLTVIPSKSQAHRLLICAAFADKPTDIICPETNRDMDATAQCLESIGANIVRTPRGYCVTPKSHAVDSPVLNCLDSGSTLRFLLPVMGALGVYTVFKMEGRLPQRPLSPLWEEMERMGCSLKFISENELRCQGQLRPGDYYIDGGVSSQFITGLLFATSLLDGDSTIHITGKLESKPYVDLTLDALKQFGIEVDDFHVRGGQVFRSPGTVTVEGDWSNAAFWLAANALGSSIDIQGLNPASVQGDRAAADLIPALNENITVSAADIPDLVPILSVVAAANQGAIFTNIRRLRLKESDRVASVIAMLKALGCEAQATEDTLTVYPARFTGGTVDAKNDHRIAMAAAVASTVCSGPVRILGAECVQKSYPRFWEEFKRLGGNYEQHLRR